MDNIRADFEICFPVPDGVCWGTTKYTVDNKRDNRHDHSAFARAAKKHTLKLCVWKTSFAFYNGTGVE